MLYDEEHILIISRCTINKNVIFRAPYTCNLCEKQAYERYKEIIGKTQNNITNLLEA